MFPTSMKSPRKDIVRSDDPIDNRRSLIPGSSSVKLASEGPSRVVHQALAVANATDGHLRKLPNRLPHRIGTWNVRGLLQPGKLEIVGKEMNAHKVDILGLSETHLKGSGHYVTQEGNAFYFSGHKSESRNGVAILVPYKLNNCVMGYNAINDRIMTIKINCKPLPINIVQVYAPTAVSSEEDIDNFYGILEETIKSLPRREMLFVQGDWNSKIGDTRADDHIRQTAGAYGLGLRNERGERFLEFCISNNLAITNSFFQHHKRRLYTWKSPGDRYRNQIDYITVDHRWRSSIMNAKTLPGADCGSDHQLLIAEVRLRLRVPRRSVRKAVRLAEHETKLFKTTSETAFKNCSEPLTANVEQQWLSFKSQVMGAFNNITQKRTASIRKKGWISKETWDIIEERKALKTRDAVTNKEKYSDLSRHIQGLCRRDKNSYLSNICSEIERHAEKFQTADLFKKVRFITRQFKPHSWTIEDKDGNPINEVAKIAERWKEYCSDLYSRDQSSDGQEADWDLTIDTEQLEPKILNSEVEAAIRKLKLHKAAGVDNITAETLKALGDRGMSKLLELCSSIWRSCQWPKDWTHSMILPLHKKGATKKCNNYRTIALISHTSKVLLHIINSRLRHYLDWQMPQEQGGFVKGKGTREQILNVRLIVEKCYEFNIPALICFIDYQKAFDHVSWKHLWKVLKEMGVPVHLIQLIRSLYVSGCGSVEIGTARSSEFRFEKGVRQGCIISPILFNIYGEYIMRKALQGWDGGITVAGTRISNLRYADDTTLITATVSEMADLLQRVEAVSLELGLKINQAKTKIMIVDRSETLQIPTTLSQYDAVDSFVYLGSTITSKGGSETEIRRRIGMAKTAMSQLHKIWKDRNVFKKTKVYIVRTLVFPIFLYGVESWTLKAADRKRIDAFEMFCWRHMLRIPWTAFRTNVSILNELKVKQRLSSLCLQRILQYFGHIARKPGDNLEKIMLTGKVDGKRSRGRSPKRWTDQVSEQLEIKLSEALHCAVDREKWRQLTHKTRDLDREDREHHDAQQ